MTDVLYFDGQCPLCTAEMDRLGKLADSGLVLRDIHELRDDTLPCRDDMLRTLHLRTAEGELLTGIEANVAAWQHTRMGLFWRWLRWPLVRPIAEKVYGRWALWRYQRLYAQDKVESHGEHRSRRH
jgi:predicted DCC family thiol-disulfide oxidoreductase YuxK